MPGAELVAVIAAAVWTCAVAKIIVVPLRIGGKVIMVAWCGTCPRLVTTPAPIVAVLKFLRRPRRIRVIAYGEHRTRNFIEQCCGGDGARAAGDGAVGDIAGADQNGRLLILHSGHGCVCRLS